MLMRPSPIEPVPGETARVARAAFRKGNLLMRIRDEIGVLYDDHLFAGLYAAGGQQAIAPWRLAIVTLVQFLENLSDRQVAEAVRGRIDLKYALSLELEDPGFDFSVLCEFRARLIAGGQDHGLLDVLLERLHERGFIKVRGKQRTDSTHVLAAVRTLNRLELVGETMRAALAEVARSAPEWLGRQNWLEWAERYGARVEQYRLPKGAAAREALAETIGRDGHDLLAALFAETAPVRLCRLPAVETLRTVWIEQFHHDRDRVRWRPVTEQPPANRRVHSPYDPEASYGTKRDTQWLGYKVHLTETCEADTPNLVTDVQTTAAGTPDVVTTPAVHGALSERGLLPGTHLVDTGYIDAPLLVASQADHAVELFGPALLDHSWRARSGQGFDLSSFTLLWPDRIAQCPAGQTSQGWRERRDGRGITRVYVNFAESVCASCASRDLCTPTKPGKRPRARRLVIHCQPEHEALQTRRREQNSEAWKKTYASRAGIEGTLSQGIRSFGLRRCRYIGQAKTHLQHIFTAAAMNLARLDAWFDDKPRAQTRQSKLAILQSTAA